MRFTVDYFICNISPAFKFYHPAKNKSYFTISLEELQKIVDERHGTGEVLVKSDGQIKEILTLDKDVGVDMDESGIISGTTNRITVHYSKKRTHAVPTERID